MSGEYLDVAMRASGLPPSVFEVEWEKCRIQHQLRTYTNDLDGFVKAGKGLMIMGPVGTGKTSAAALVAREAITWSHSVRWVYLPDLVGDLSSKDKREHEVRVQSRAEIVVWDDFGVIDLAPWHVASLDRIVDARYRRGLPMIVTTNLTGAQLRNLEECGRMIDRWREMLTGFSISGDSMRSSWKMEE